MTFAVIAGTIGIVLVTVAIGVIVDRRFGILPRPDELAGGNVRVQVTRRSGYVPVPGDTAATAVRANGDQLAKLRTSQRCTACKGSLAAAGDDERVRYGGSELLLIHFACAQCGGARAMYIDDRA